MDDRYLEQELMIAEAEIARAERNMERERFQYGGRGSSSAYMAMYAAQREQASQRAWKIRRRMAQLEKN